jgi:hypothetical protein
MIGFLILIKMHICTITTVSSITLITFCHLCIKMDHTGCGKLTSFFEYEMPYEKGS